jgi:glycosyltransferase involved in cell wall biosynthesis
MKVLHVITGLAAGGAENQLELLLRHTRHRAEVAVLRNPGSVGRRIAESGITVYELGMRSNSQVSVIFRLARIMREGHYDTVHVHLYRACVFGRPAARLARVPLVVTTEHSLGEKQIEGRPKSPFVRRLYLATDFFSEATIAVSDETKRFLVEWGIPREKIRVIPNGLDLARFGYSPADRKLLREQLGIPPEDFVMGSVGRLHRLKRFDLLIEAAAPLLSQGKTWLLLVGEGDERPRLEKLAREAGVADRTIFAGERADVSRLLSVMDLFASPSEEETFGLAILEAAASGLPVVAVRCPALDGLRLPGLVGIPAGDSTRLRRILLDEALDERDRDNGFEERAGLLEGRYDIRNVAAAIDDLYEALRDGRRGP